MDSLSGVKARTNTSYTPMIEKLGGAPVLLEGGEIYSSFQNGGIDTASWSRTGITDFKLQEVTSYVIESDSGHVNNWMFMNLAA